jgi:hypothetical protein
MKKLLKSFVVSLILAGGFIAFQAQDFSGYNFDDNNPNIDQPTREYYSHYGAIHSNGLEGDVVTDASGFDNYNIGIDNAETNVVTSQQNPLWIFTSVNGGASQNAYFTTNAGLNWTLSNPSYQAGTCCDPWATYTGSGLLIYGSGVSGQYVYRSTNNGATWTTPVLSVSGNDRNTIASEQTGMGPYANYVYASITGSGGAPFARSTDLGATWTTTTTLAPHNTPGVMIAVGPNGATKGGCVMVITSSGPATGVTYYFHRSTNGGATFTQNVSNLTVAGYSGTYSTSAGRLHINGARHRTYPMIAMDNSNGPYSGRLYLVYSSNIPAGDAQHPDIKLQYSTDQGTTWSPYKVVNNSPNPTASDQWFPAVWCEPKTGKLYVKWYSDEENPATFQTSVWASYSTDGGQTFVPNQKVSNATFTYPCPACSPACYRGDYDAITANTKVGFATWYDARSCNYQTMGGYFPDFALKVNPTTINGLSGNNDSQFVSVSVPAVKLYSDTAVFSATVANPPGTGTISLTFLNKTTSTPQNILTSFPDSLRLRVKTSGGVPNNSYTINIKANGPNGTPVHVRTVTVSVLTGIISFNNEIPESYALFQNYPNPFNPTTQIRFDIAKAGNVKIGIYDITGRKITELVNQNYNAGKYVADFNASEYASGVYFYKIETADFTSIKKMMLIK